MIFLDGWRRCRNLNQIFLNIGPALLGAGFFVLYSIRKGLRGNQLKLERKKGFQLTFILVNMIKKIEDRLSKELLSSKKLCVNDLFSEEFP